MTNLYITSTHKYAGKTFISTGIAATMQSLGYSTTIYKPIETGCTKKNGFIQSPDITFIKTIDPYINTKLNYLYKADTEPLIASELENESIDVDLILSEYKKINSNSECTIIDGNSGILSPLSANIQTIDLIKKMSVPLLIVTTPDINSINNTLLTIEAAQEKDVPVRGVVINKIEDTCSKTLLSSIPRIIEEYTNVKILGLIQKLHPKSSPEDIITAILNGIDIESVFNIKIEKLDMN